MGTILLIVLVLLLVGALPTWSHSRSWGYFPSGGARLGRADPPRSCPDRAPLRATCRGAGTVNVTGRREASLCDALGRRDGRRATHGGRP